MIPLMLSIARESLKFAQFPAAGSILARRRAGKYVFSPVLIP